VSGEETRDFLLYCQCVSFLPDVPEREAITDLFWPLRRYGLDAAATCRQLTRFEPDPPA